MSECSLCKFPALLLVGIGSGEQERLTNLENAWSLSRVSRVPSTERFARDLSDSQFIHLVHEYIGLRASANAIRWATEQRSTTRLRTFRLRIRDVLSFVHAVASATGGSGYGHISPINGVSPPGQDECFDSTFTVCYSPDNINTFFFVLTTAALTSRTLVMCCTP